MALLQLSLCALSIYTTFLVWGLLQERITKTPYVAAATLFHPNPQPEYFRSPLFLNAIQAALSALTATFYVVVRGASSSPSRPLTSILGFDALTPSGSHRALESRGNTTAKEGKRVGKVAAIANGRPKDPESSQGGGGGLSRFVSPLLVRYLAISLLQSTASQLGFLSLRYISYPTLTLAKSCKLVPVLLMNVLLYRRKFAPQKYVVVLLVTLGIWMFMAFAPAKPSSKSISKAPASSSLWGLGLLGLNLILDGATNSTQDEVFSLYGRETVSAGQMMLVMNALSATLMSIGLVLPTSLFSAGQGGNELSRALAFISRHPEVVRDMLAYALAGAVGQVAIFETLERFGSLTLVSITVTRKLFTMLLSVLVYKHQLSALQWLGVAVVFTGIGLEAREKRREGLAKKALAERKRKS
ncbi:UAA transporter [Violaceomyces palustris]|uniref:UAA transporter n=1 Tax=Violaceomyces palustris TaxID=1673888 RepID=A0ACD0NWB7_9BASI|nr:UAA transporter [Violaceomyces palustris]